LHSDFIVLSSVGCARRDARRMTHERQGKATADRRVMPECDCCCDLYPGRRALDLLEEVSGTALATSRALDRRSPCACFTCPLDPRATVLDERQPCAAAAAGLLAALLVSAPSAYAGQCNAQAPVAQAPAFVDDRADLTEPAHRADAQPGAAALDDTLAPSAADLTVAVVGRPTGPEVQPCRHLPREQMIECLQRSAGIDGASR
jgi:hypothetical protein